MAGKGKHVIAFIPEPQKPEQMYKLFLRVVGDIDDIVEAMCLMSLLDTFKTYSQVLREKSINFGASKFQNARNQRL